PSPVGSRLVDQAQAGATLFRRLPWPRWADPRAQAMGVLGPLWHWAGERGAVVLPGLLAWLVVLLVTFDLYSVRTEELSRLTEQNGQLFQELQRLTQQRAAEEAERLAMEGSPLAPGGALALPAPGDEAPRGLLRQPLLSNPRRLGALYGVVSTNTASSGCYSFSASTDAVVSDASCIDSQRCPACFIFTGASAATLRIAGCSTAYVGSTQLSNQLLEYTFVNTDASNSLTVEAHATSAFASALTTATVAASTRTTADCYTGGSNKLFFQG
ncbi:unnamed protein product, partial [Prorocentrum cordatum]